jgi:hypothetical protein
MEDVYFLDRVLTVGVSSTADRPLRSERRSTLFSETMSKETHSPNIPFPDLTKSLVSSPRSTNR